MPFVEHLKVSLLLVLGHEGCGGVKAALEGMGSRAQGAMGKLIMEVEPAVKPVLEQQEEVDDVLHEAVCASVWYTMSRILERSSIIAHAVVKGELLLKGAVYSLTTSQVTILKEEG